MTDIDELMSRDPTDLSAQDIDTIIAYHRTQRQRKASGEKTTKPKIDISEVMQKFTASSKPATTKMERRL